LPAELDLKPSAALTKDQGDALALAAKTLPDGWTVVAEADPSGDQITVRVVGRSFSTMARFAARTHPDQFAAFLERVRRGHG
jgi:hypothetical protein